MRRRALLPVLLLPLALALRTALASSGPCSSHVEQCFWEFEHTFNRTYASVEEREFRLRIFAENLREIEHARARDPGVQYSHLTPFADWSPEEIVAGRGVQAYANSDVTQMARSRPLRVSGLPESFDWRAKGAVNRIKTAQGSCGCCWAYAATANIEGVNFLKTGTLLSLSEQQLVDCNSRCMGCNGCYTGPLTFQYLIEEGVGMEMDADYPYTATNGSCRASNGKEKVFVKDWLKISVDEDQIAAALMRYGPLSAVMNADPVIFYSGGIVARNASACRPHPLNHGVDIVGFGAEGGVKYWIVRNSWGTAWGEDGYFRLARGGNACGIGTQVYTARLEAPWPWERVSHGRLVLAACAALAASALLFLTCWNCRRLKAARGGPPQVPLRGGVAAREAQVTPGLSLTPMEGARSA